MWVDVVPRILTVYEPREPPLRKNASWELFGCHGRYLWHLGLIECQDCSDSGRVQFNSSPRSFQQIRQPAHTDLIPPTHPTDFNLTLIQRPTKLAEQRDNREHPQERYSLID